MLTLAFGLLIWAAAAILCLFVGSTGVGWPVDWVGYSRWENLIASVRQGPLKYRLEPTLIASLVGAALGAAGVVYQVILRNPLADPYLLGATSGASLAAYLWQFGFTTSLLSAIGSGPEAMSQQAFAFEFLADAPCGFIEIFRSDEV